MRERLPVLSEQSSDLKPQIPGKWLKEVKRYIDEQGSLHQEFVLRGRKRFNVGLKRPHK